MISSIQTQKYLLRTHSTIVRSECQHGQHNSDQAEKSRAKISEIKKALKEKLSAEDYRNLTKRK